MSRIPLGVTQMDRIRKWLHQRDPDVWEVKQSQRAQTEMVWTCTVLSRDSRCIRGGNVQAGGPEEDQEIYGCDERDVSW